MRKGIVACPVHSDNETTPNCPDCRPYMTKPNTKGRKKHRWGVREVVLSIHGVGVFFTCNDNDKSMVIWEDGEIEKWNGAEERHFIDMPKRILLL